MKKIGFVVPWHGENIPGGAEAALRSITSKLKDTMLEIEILTTCVKQFSSDWNVNYYKPGEYEINGIITRRFKVRKRNTELFDLLNQKIINGEKLTTDEEIVFMQEMINSSDLYKYMGKHVDEYSLFIFIPYMFGTTYFGSRICPEKSVHIPCAHEEPYIHLDIFREMFERSRGMIYNSEPERKLVDSLFDMKQVKECVAGLGMDTDIRSDSKRFRKKHNVENPYILYAGRKDTGKNINLLLRYFQEYRKRNKNDLCMVLIGGGNVDIPTGIKKYTYDLGYVDIQDKYDAYAGALCLCQPSIHESFSYVIMESWLSDRPVLVHADCDVTKNFVIDANGGLYFEDYFEFEGALNYLIKHTNTAMALGKNGHQYVARNYEWNIVMEKYIKFIEGCADAEM